MTNSKTRQDRDFYRRIYQDGEGPWSNLNELDRRTAEWIEIVDPPESSRVLDLGTGRGRIVRLFRSVGFEAFGLDYLRDPLLDARDSFTVETPFVHADAFEPPFRVGTFSCLVDYGLLHHVRKSGWSSYHNQTLRLLRPGGYFFVNVFHISDAHAERSGRDWVYHRGHYDHFFSRESLDEFLGDCYERCESGLIEDGKHRFLHALYRKETGDTDAA